MFGLSRKADYAVVALARLARHAEGSHQAQAEQAWAGADAAGADGAAAAVSARELAAADGLPPALLSGVLKRLQRAGVVRSRRGVHGGFTLARDPGQIRLSAVIRAIEGPELVRLTRCCDDGHGGPDGGDEPCLIQQRCPITRAIRRLNGRMTRLLEQTTLRDLLTPDGPEAPTVARPPGSTTAPPPDGARPPAHDAAAAEAPPSPGRAG